MHRQISTEKLVWDDVKLFLALCRQPTVGAAARALRLDASTVSRRLATLEDALATSLFDRGRDGVARTEAAEALLPIAEEMEQSMARFSNLADGLERDAAGVVRITCPPDVAEVVLVPLLPDLLRTHPKLRLSLDPAETLRDLTRREADLALRSVRPSGGDLVMTRLTTARWILAAAPQLASRLGTLRDFAAAPWVSWGERLAGIGAAQWLTKHVKHADPVLRSDSLMVQLAAVSTGVGVALLPEPTVRHYRLVPLKLSAALREAAEQWPRDELYLVTHRALQNVPRVRVVWDLLLERWGGR
ncbi:MAG TPA: LysR family transcriptional regulator [Polyangiaceae bacterium]|nr:LysR family transcriptional regulator [Polyangiaceae bacterium]